jgi:hypothetical protein
MRVGYARVSARQARWRWLHARSPAVEERGGRVSLESGTKDIAARGDWSGDRGAGRFVGSFGVGRIFSVTRGVRDRGATRWHRGAKSVWIHRAWFLSQPGAGCSNFSESRIGRFGSQVGSTPAPVSLNPLLFWAFCPREFPVLTSASAANRAGAAPPTSAPVIRAPPGLVLSQRHRKLTTSCAELSAARSEVRSTKAAKRLPRCEPAACRTRPTW